MYANLLPDALQFFVDINSLFMRIELLFLFLGGPTAFGPRRHPPDIKIHFFAKLAYFSHRRPPTAPLNLKQPMLRCSSKLRTSTVRPNMALRQLSSPKVNHGGLLSVDQIQPEKNGAVRFGSSYKVPDHHMPGAGLEPLVGTMEAMDGNTAAVHVACKSLI